MADFEPRTLTCNDCGAEFTFTAEEQQFYTDKGFQEPKRCPTCRSKKKQMRRVNRQFTKVNCSKCGAETEVPFVPRGDRPVYCNKCFEEQKANAA